MTLSKRALLVIFPVVFLTIISAAYISYVSLLETTRRFEQNRLDLALTEVLNSYSKYAMFAENQLNVIIESSAFKSYLAQDNSESFSQVALSNVIESSIKDLQQQPSQQLSLLIHANNEALTEEFFFELSNDPFSEPSLKQRQLHSWMQQHNKLKYLTHLITQDGQLSISMNRVLDRDTLSTPNPSQLNNSVIIAFSLLPTRFTALLEKVKTHYGVEVELIPLSETQAPNKDVQTHGTANEIFANAPLGQHHIAHIHVPESYLLEQVKNIKQVLIAVCFLFFSLASSILYFLLNKYVTQPITRFQRELSQVFQNKQANITIKNSENNEIGQLERTFSQLYGDLSKAFKKTKALSEQDSLTRLHNVRFLSHEAMRLINEVKQDTNLKLALIYLDLDNFKFINDRFDHSSGNALLQSLAKRMIRTSNEFQAEYSNELVQEIAIGRIASDEFAIMLKYKVPNNPSLNLPKQLAQNILDHFSDGYSFSLGNFPITCSIAIALCPDDDTELSQLVVDCDHTMQHAKLNGKNQILFYSKEIAAKARRIKDIEQELVNFNPDEECHLVYMPLVDTNEKRIGGFEVLIRWISPKLGFVGPDEFIPISESLGLFHKIDSWVVENALKNYQTLKEKLGYHYKLSINLSSAQLTSNQVSIDMIILAKKYNVDPAYIQLEMTETLNVKYTVNTEVLLKVLVAQGFNIAIDDFGTGYTAVHQLFDYPASMVKFDKTFIDKVIDPSKEDRLKALIQLCHSQGMEVTAEGVETEEMADKLTRLGCNYLQGYAFGKPAKLEELNFQHTWLTQQVSPNNVLPLPKNRS